MKKAFRSLSGDEREELGELLAEPGWRAFLKLLDGMAREEEEKLLTLAPEATALLNQRLRADGARGLERNVAKLPDHIRVIQKKEEEHDEG